MAKPRTAESRSALDPRVSYIVIWILAMAALVLVLVGGAALAYIQVCGGQPCANQVGICCAVAKRPPWTLLASLAAAPALLRLWIWRTRSRQAEIAHRNWENTQRDAQIAQAAADGARAAETYFPARFAEAVRLLPDNRLSAVGGVCALEQLARESSRHRIPVVETLSAFLREGMYTASGEEVGAATRAAFTSICRLRHEFEDIPVDLAKAPLRGVKAPGADLRKASFVAADLAGATLFGGRFGGADLFEADLRKASLRSVDFANANLMWAKLFDADLDGAILAGADLEHADLSQASLFDTDLSSARLDGTTFKEAYFNAETKFPPGFNPREAGLIDVNEERSERDASAPLARVEGAPTLDQNKVIFRVVVEGHGVIPVGSAHVDGYAPERTHSDVRVLDAALEAARKHAEEHRSELRPLYAQLAERRGTEMDLKTKLLQSSLDQMEKVALVLDNVPRGGEVFLCEHSAIFPTSGPTLELARARHDDAAKRGWLGAEVDDPVGIVEVVFPVGQLDGLIAKLREDEALRLITDPAACRKAHDRWAAERRGGVQV